MTETLERAGLRKAAILLLTVGEATSAALLKRLNDDEVQSVTSEMAHLASIAGEEAKTVLEEFYRATTAPKFISRPGREWATRILTTAFGTEGARRHVERLPAPQETVGSESLRRADPEQLARLIQDEHPQTVALILSYLHGEQASMLLASLDPALRCDVARRMARLDLISPMVIARITDVIKEKMADLGETRHQSYGGTRAVAELFNRLEADVRDELLKGISEQEEELAESIRELMFVFDDFLKVESNAIREIVAKIDRKLLVVALKGTTDELRDRFLKCMSQRGGDMFREDMEALGPVKIREVEAAQKQVITSARQLERDGIISLQNGGEEQYVG
ncbi:MAG: flagellar motor switch protein FliG [Acidobacteria bacterium]|nr:flagellar motor switch protein FliG [Acidobacteriota bacterium]